jgi:UDP-N-acetylmuramoyl-L-alanyl-D-glutamate--2,6-diaminopimelate ligase
MKELIKKIIPPFLLDRYHFSLALAGAFFYGFPGKKMKIIGVTGTNGKSTVTHFISKILEEAGYKTAFISSIKFKIGEKEWPNSLKMTMPGRFKIQKFLKKAADRGCKYAVLEVTSEGIKQYRHKFINFEAVLITNLALEHIEAHGSFEKYKEAKGKLFKACRKIHIVNKDDSSSLYFLQFPAEKKIKYGVEKGKILIEGREIFLDWKMPALFNLYNAAAAMAAAMSQGIPLEKAKKTLEKIEGIPGRMETAVNSPFKIILDYAHTPDSLGKVYRFLLKIKPEKSKLICLLGACGGGRDKWKRPELGRIAAESCHAIILSNEDPYDENPGRILSEIESGISNFQFPLFKILDRRKAIRKALSLAKPGDVVIITGKGSEPWMCLAKGRKIPWNEKEIILEEFKKIKIQA